MKPYKVTIRDQIVVGLARFVIRFATKSYRLRVEAIMDYGWRSAIRDEREGLPAPPGWGELE